MMQFLFTQDTWFLGLGGRNKKPRHVGGVGAGAIQLPQSNIHLTRASW
jgi:hypothetical protein